MPTRIFHPQAADRNVLDLVHEDEIGDLVDRLSVGDAKNGVSWTQLVAERAGPWPVP